MMISRGFNEMVTLLSTIAESLDRIESLIKAKGGTDISEDKVSLVGFTGGNISPNEKLDKKQAAGILGISVRTLDRYRRKGIIPFYQIDGGKVSFRYRDIIAVRDKVRGDNHGRDYFSELVTISSD